MTKAEILAALACRPVPFDAGGVAMYVTPLTLAQRLAVGAFAEANPDAASADLWALTFALAACDATGDRLFPGADPAALVAAVKSADVNAGAVEAVSRRVVELSRAPDPKA